MQFKFHFSVLLFFVHYPVIFAQGVRLPISGTVKSDSITLQSVHVINKTSNRGTVSNPNGQFSIHVKENDTLYFSEISHKLKTIVIDRKIIESGKLDVVLVINTQRLEEVIIFKNKQLTNPLGIPNMGKKKLSKTEREINYYSQASTARVIADVLLAPLLNMIPFMPQRQGGINDLYYVLSGKRKKFRKLQNLKRQDEVNAYNFAICRAMRKKLGDSFFLELGIEPGQIDAFLGYCLAYDTAKLFEEKRQLELINLFVEQAKTYNPD